MIHGEDLILAINGTPLAASKSCSLSKKQSFIDVSDPTNGRWEACVPKTLSWSMSSDCLLATMDAYKTLDAAWKAGTPLSIRFYDTEYNENETGTAYIESLDLQCSKNNLAKMSISLRGSGALSNGSWYIPFTKQLLQSGKYYAHTIPKGTYRLIVSDNGKVYGGSINLSNRTLVRVTTNGCDMFFSSNINIITLAQEGENINKTNYSTHIDADADIWLDAGTWYVVTSNQNHTYDPGMKGINKID